MPGHLADKPPLSCIFCNTNVLQVALILSLLSLDLEFIYLL